MSDVTHAEQQEARLLELAEAYLDDDLTDGEARELRALVKRDKKLRERFLHEVRWHIHLTDRLRTPGIPLAERIEAVLDAEGRAPRVADAVAARIAARSSRRNKISTRFLRMHRRRSATPWWIAVAAGLLFAIGLLVVLPDNHPSVATIVGDRGTIERGGSSLHLDMHPQSLSVGDVLIADGSELLMKFPDGTTVDLSAGARLTVRSGVQRGEKHLELERGSLVARVSKQKVGEPLLVSTAQANATVLGTVFRVRVETVGTRLTVEEGRIAFTRRTGGEGVEVPAGRSAIAGIDGSLALVEPVKPAVAAKRAPWIPEPFSSTGGRPFGDDSPYNREIPAKPVLDVQSSTMAFRLAGQPGVLALFRHALPVYDVDASTPLHVVTALRRADRSSIPETGLRIPEGAMPNSGSNRALVLLDWSERRAWELYRVEWNGADLTIGSGAFVRFDSDGIPKPASGYAGGSYLAGLLRVREIAQGRIPHALAFGTKFACKGTWRHLA
ncbi:MAG TPA: FecR family protein [Planctomycetota bacterium]|nr:FecR family protein [Planctomycetota bacterium]